MASKGTITLDVHNPITAVPASLASVMSLSAAVPPITMSSGSISGDLTVLNAAIPVVAPGASVGGSSILTDILANHVKHVDPANPPEMPMPDVNIYAKYATTAYVPGKASYDNVYIPANTNPTIAGPITFRGVLLVKSPNNVKFTGNVNIQGTIVSDNSGVGTLLTNVLTFSGSGNANMGLESLPDVPPFQELRKMGGLFVLAPGYDVKFSGNFNAALDGSIVGDRVNISGSADLQVDGSIFALKQTLTMGTNGKVNFIPNPTGLHFGLRFSDRWVPNASSYDEVKP